MKIENTKYDWMLSHFEDGLNNGINRQEFEEKISKRHSNFHFSINSNLNKYETVNIYLNDKKKIVNAIMFDNQYLVSLLRYIDKDNVARDRNSDYGIFLSPLIYDKFNFNIGDIKCLEKQPDKEIKYFGGLFTRAQKLSEVEIVTRTDKWTELPNKKITINKLL